MVRDPNQTERTIVLSDTSGIRSARSLIGDAASHLGFDPDHLADIQLAVGELVTNAVEHGGGGDVVVRVVSTPAIIDVTVTSAGAGAAPRLPPTAVLPDALQGRGLVIASAIADTLTFENEDGQIVARCRFTKTDSTGAGIPIPSVTDRPNVDFQAVFDGSMSPLAILDAKLRYVAANAAYAASVGRNKDQLIGHTVFDVFPESMTPSDSDAGQLRASMIAALETGKPQTLPLLRYDVEDPVTGSAVERYWSVTNTPIVGGDGAVFVVNHPEEVTSFISERVGHETSGQQPVGSSLSRGIDTALSGILARLTYLSDLSAAMVAAESVDEIAAAVMHYGMTLVDAQAGSFAQVDGEHIELSNQTGIDDDVKVRWTRYQMTPGGDPFSDAILTGELVAISDPDAFVERYPHLASELNPAHAAWTVLPFEQDGSVVGAVGFIFATPTQLDVPARLAMSSIANIVQQSLARVMMLTEQRRAFSAMSSALLSPRLDSHVDVEIDTTYRAAAQRIRAGGDWYDVIRLTSGGLLFVIGDVADHGARAVGEMARARATVHAFAVLDLECDEVARRASEVLSRLGTTHTTCVIATYDPARRELVWTTAGHPYPLVVNADGSTEFLSETHGPPLGVASSYGAGRRSMQSGDRIVFYTDGLIERRDEIIDVGLERLEDSARTLCVAEALTADALVDAVVASSYNNDDIAVLIVSIQ